MEDHEGDEVDQGLVERPPHERLVDEVPTTQGGPQVVGDRGRDAYGGHDGDVLHHLEYPTAGHPRNEGDEDEA